MPCIKSRWEIHKCTDNPAALAFMSSVVLDRLMLNFRQFDKTAKHLCFGLESPRARNIKCGMEMMMMRITRNDSSTWNDEMLTQLYMNCLQKSSSPYQYSTFISQRNVQKISTLHWNFDEVIVFVAHFCLGSLYKETCSSTSQENSIQSWFRHSIICTIERNTGQMAV